MVQYRKGRLDAVFVALADPTRRGVLAMLSGGSANVSDLARPYRASLTGFMKHLTMLERAGLVARVKEGRVGRCSISPEPLRDAAEWLAHYRKFWDERLDALARYLAQEEGSWQKSRNGPHSPSPASTRPRPKRFGGRGRSPTR
jgi:DNA-binding transcriptional ArsR family regulator